MAFVCWGVAGRHHPCLELRGFGAGLALARQWRLALPTPAPLVWPCACLSTMTRRTTCRACVPRKVCSFRARAQLLACLSAAPGAGPCRALAKLTRAAGHPPCAALTAAAMRCAPRWTRRTRQGPSPGAGSTPSAANRQAAKRLPGANRTVNPVALCTVSALASTPKLLCWQCARTAQRDRWLQ